MKQDWTLELKVAKNAAKAANSVLRQYYGKLTEVRTKRNAGLVTAADKKSELVIRKLVAKTFPDDEFLGEESGLSSKRSRRRWIVDPLDGTTNFVHGFPFFCSSIALSVDKEIVVGVVDAPILKTQFWATRGGGAFQDGRRLTVTNQSQLKNAFLATGFYYLRDEELNEQIRIFGEFISQTRGVRRAGSAALDLSMVANGVFDAFWERGLNSWDVAAGTLLVEEAGGIVTDYSNKPYKMGDETLIAGSKPIHKKIQKKISGVLKRK